MGLKIIEYKAAHILEELILVILILLNVLDFLKILAPDLDFIKKIISWTCLGYLLYSVSLTKQLLGRRKKIIDTLIILILLLLVFKNFIGFSLVAYDEIREMAVNEGKVSLTYPLIEYIRDPEHDGLRASNLEHMSFNLGAILLILMALWLTFRTRIEKPSVLHVLHEDEPINHTFGTVLKKFLMIFIVLVGFFIIVFNLMMEWLAISVDASLAIFTIFFYILTAFRRHHKHFSTESYINKFGSAGEEIYEKVIELFHDKSTFLLGLSGILVLHLLTDVGIFIVPYILGIKDVLYFSQLGAGHEALMYIFLKDLGFASDIIEEMMVVLIYFFNILALLYLLTLPGVIWYKLFKRKNFNVGRLNLTLFLCSVITFILSPAFIIRKISSSNIIGVDILTKSILENWLDIRIISLIILVLFAVTLSISSNHKIKKFLIILSIVLIDLFFAYYIFLYFISIVEYYVVSLGSLLSYKTILIFFYFVLFLIITSLFYIGGFFAFILETKKEFKYMH